MEPSPIYTTEPMATRALAAEIRHDAHRFLRLLENRSGAKSFGVLQSVACEAEEQIDVKLEFERADAVPYRVGIEAKFDHALTRDQIERELSVMDRLFVLVVNSEAVPQWLTNDYPDVPVISWKETLDCFADSRITFQDLASIRIVKSVVERHFNTLDLTAGLEGWGIRVERGGSGMPSIVFESPALPDGRTLRGHIQMAGRGMPETLEDVRFDSLIGISVPEDTENYFDPSQSEAVPGWIGHLLTLQSQVLAGEEDRLLVSRDAPRASKRALGRWKLPLAKKYLGEHAYLAKGYTDGWALGLRTKKVGLEQLDELAAITVEIFARWYRAETR